MAEADGNVILLQTELEAARMFHELARAAAEQAAALRYELESLWGSQAPEFDNPHPDLSKHVALATETSPATISHRDAATP